MLNLFFVIVGIFGFLLNCSTDAKRPKFTLNDPSCHACQSIKLYETNSSTSNSVTIKEEFIRDVYDLPGLKWNGSESHWGCLVGEWIDYTEPNYTGGITPSIIRAVGTGGACTDYYNKRSFRFVGPPKDCRQSSLNLYEGQGYEGKVRLYDAAAGAERNLTASFQSFIITGSVPWTFYLEPNFEGESFCSSSNTTDWNDIWNVWNDTHVADIGSLGLMPGDVHSFQVGCAPDWPFTATASTAALSAASIPFTTLSGIIWLSVIAMIVSCFVIVSSDPII